MKYLLAIVFAAGILLFALACALEPEESPAAGTDTGKTETSISAATPATGTASETDTDRMPETATDANGRADAAQKDLISGMVSMVSPDLIAVYLPNEQFSAADLMQGGKASSFVTRRKNRLLKEVSNLNKRYER